jgi:hypothetical protein
VLWWAAFALAGTWTQQGVWVKDPLTGAVVGGLRQGTELDVLWDRRQDVEIRLPGPIWRTGLVTREVLGEHPPQQPPVEEPLRIAVCVEGRAELLASLHEGELDPMRGQPWEEGEDSTLLAAGLELTQQTWYDGEQPLEGTPFPTPFLRSDWNDGGSTAWSAADCEGPCGDQRVVLGACPGAGPFTTRPVQRAVGAVPVEALPEGWQALSPAHWLRPDGGQLVGILPVAPSEHVHGVLLLISRPDGTSFTEYVRLDGRGC